MTCTTDRKSIATQAASGLRQFAQTASQVSVVLGFDGFIDSIIQVVDQRQDDQHYSAIDTIETFGQRILAAAGQSSNFELVTTLRKLGGNGPIMANAMAAAGLDVTYIGALGFPAIDPVFEELAERAHVHSIIDAGSTDALEFADGKLLMGKYDHLSSLDIDHVRQVMGDKYDQTIAGAQLIGMVNWTMLPGLESIWQDLMDRVIPAVGSEINGRRRIVFVDLADPQKRPVSDLQRALNLCSKLNEHVDVILGTNLKESGQVLAALGLPVPAELEPAIEASAVAIREKLDLSGVVVHPRRGAAAAVKTEGQVDSATFEGPFVKQPKLSTGAGDNFNAGFCLGRLAGLPVEQALCTGTATSGYYVRNAASPTLAQLAGFCDDLPDPE